ncbi:MAG TPA: glycosyltransferase family 4 protein [Caulobacteraceae bacterium]|nr:glycosyltransferase family 4 protein [Caulobacteraceae bacterium]
MRILLINHEFTTTGASTLLLRLALHLKGAGHVVTVGAINPAPGLISQAYAAADIPLVPRMAPADYDVSIANTVAAASFVIEAGPVLPTIWWLHEAEIGLAILLHHPEQLRAFQLASAVVFQTDFQLNDVYRSFTYALERRRLHVFPNGIEVEDRAPGDRIPPKRGVLRVVSAGTVSPRKRPGDVIEAVARLRKRLDVELVICGALEGGIDAKAERTIAAHPGRIQLTGEVDRPECLAWIASADIFCLASDSESHPVTVMEAGRLGRPLVLSDLRCYAGEYRHGVNCLLFPVGDVELLSHALGALAADPARRERLGEAARSTAGRSSERALHARFDALLEETMALRLRQDP